MTRTAVVFGLILGLALAVWGVRSGEPTLLAPAAVLVLASLGTAAGNRVAHMALCLVAVILLGRFLVLFFREQALWPAVPGVGLAMFTFGFGVLGLAIDRYRPRNGDTGASLQGSR